MSQHSSFYSYIGYQPKHQQVEEYRFQDQILLRQGVLETTEDLQVEETYQAGFNLVAVHSGSVISESVNGQKIEIATPSIFIANSVERYSLLNQFKSGDPLRYTLLQLSSQWLEQQHILLPPILQQNQSLMLHHLTMDNTFLALTMQLFQNPVHDSLKPLYYSGKACEFASLSLQYLCHAQEPANRPLSQREKNSLKQAKEILIAEMETPPKLEILAARVGLNTRKLTQGFRQLFGNSVYGWLQEYRLQTAYNMLLNEGESISSVAYYVGYTPAHFSVAFRKRFGILPGDVRKGHFTP